MLKLQPYEQRHEEFAESVAHKIVYAQDSNITEIFFSELPQSILDELEELHYPVKFDGIRYCVTVL